MECTFRDPREDGDHGVGAVLLVHVGERHHVGAVGQECPAQEFVGHEDVYHLK